MSCLSIHCGEAASSQQPAGRLLFCVACRIGQPCLGVSGGSWTDVWHDASRNDNVRAEAESALARERGQCGRAHPGNLTRGRWAVAGRRWRWRPGVGDGVGRHWGGGEKGAEAAEERAREHQCSTAASAESERAPMVSSFRRLVASRSSARGRGRTTPASVSHRVPAAVITKKKTRRAAAAARTRRAAETRERERVRERTDEMMPACTHARTHAPAARIICFCSPLALAGASPRPVCIRLPSPRCSLPSLPRLLLRRRRRRWPRSRRRRRPRRPQQPSRLHTLYS